MFFGEVRPFDEIYRQGQQNQADQQSQSQSGEQSQQGGSQTARLAELQKQVINATWKLQRRPESTVTPQYRKDAPVVRDAQAQALEQANAQQQRTPDPSSQALWTAVTHEMDQALNHLTAATNSPASLPQALASEQSAYQALLKLQAREHEVVRSRNSQSRSQSSSQQARQQQLNQMDLTEQENRYETQREAQAQPPQSAERREQLQVINRLQELARRQDDLNERLKELQTALQEAKSDQEREDIQRRLKRLREQEQQMLADVDELQQRMSRPENQSRMSEQRQQLDQARNDIQRAAEAAERESVSQALAAGTRAQRQLQDTRDEMRQQSASQFAEDMRQMRNDARQLAQQQEQVSNNLDNLADSRQQRLSDSREREALLNQLSEQTQRLTNLLDQATQVSQQAETTEPLLSKQLYDTIRKFNQEDARTPRDLQDELLRERLLTRSLYDRLQQSQQDDSAKALDWTAEMLRQGYLPQAGQTEQRARAGIGQLKQGVERAAESVLGDETEALRLARQEINDLVQQLNREMAQAQTNELAGAGGTNELASAARSARANRQDRQNSARSQNQQSPNEADGQQANQNAQAQREGFQQQNGSPQGNGSRQRQGEQASSQASPSDQQNQNSQAQGNGQRPGGSVSNPSDRSNPSNPSAQQPGSEQARADQSTPSEREGNRAGSRNAGQRNRLGAASAGANRGANNGNVGGWLRNGVEDWLNENFTRRNGPITGNNFGPWSDRLRNVEEMLDQPELRSQVATARERARLTRQEFKRGQQKPDWAVVRLQVVKPLVEVRQRLTEELARRESKESLVPIDRDPVPTRYSELVRRYYEKLGKDK